jgi:hypothetical protein
MILFLRMHEPHPVVAGIIGLIGAWGLPLAAWVMEIKGILEFLTIGVGFIISVTALLFMWFPRLKPESCKECAAVARKAASQPPPTDQPEP